MRVFLTGGTGLLGSHVAERLVREGHEVRALVRPGSDARFLSELGCRLCTGDVTDPESLARGVAEADGVVHAAAIVVSDAGGEEYERVNVGGTENVLRVAADRGLRRVVHVSSVAVYGGAAAIRGGGIDETAPRDTPLPPGEVYARSKRAAERVVWEFAARAPTPEVVVVRPDVVYGERDRAVIPRVVRALKGPAAFLIGTGRRALPLVYAGNVADGIVRALSRPGVGGRAYNLTRDFPITQRQFFGYAVRALGRRPVFVPVPYPLAYALAWAAEALAGARGAGAPALTRRRVAFFRSGNPFECERAVRELGWGPSVPHREAVRRAVEWHLASR